MAAGAATGRPFPSGVSPGAAKTMIPMPDSSRSPSSASPTRFVELPLSTQVRRLRIEYRWVGSADPQAPLAVFLHEGLGSVAMWKDWPARLCERLGLRGLLYSRPGYGASSPRAPEEHWPVDFLERQARDGLPALLDALAIGPAQRQRMVVIGHSDGASIALLYAALHRDAVGAAIAIAPHTFVEACTLAGIAEARHAYLDLSSGLRAHLARYHADVDSAFWGWNTVWLSSGFRHWDMREQLSHIRCPVLVAQGDDDRYGTLAQLHAIAERVPQTRQVVLPAYGHAPHLEACPALDDAIAEFIAALPRHVHGMS